MTEGNNGVEPEEIIDSKLEYLMGEVRDTLLTHVRSMEAPWSKMSEVDQGEKIAAIEQAARYVVRVAAHSIANGGFESVTVTLGKFTVDKGKIKGSIEAKALSEHVHLLADHQNDEAVIVLCDPKAYMGERAPAKPDPDEPHLGFVDEDGVIHDNDDEPEEEPDNNHPTEEDEAAAITPSSNADDGGTDGTAIMPDVPPSLDRRPELATV